MRTVLTWLALAVTPAGVFWVARLGLERFARGPRSRPGVDDIAVPGRSLERLVGDLRRLEAEYQRISTSDQPGRRQRLRAVGLAYDDTLRSCCRLVGLADPSEPPLTALGRLETEAALAQAGVTW